MHVDRIATWDVRSVGPDDSLDRAISLMESHRIRHLPVIEQHRPVGMLSDRDLLLAVGWQQAIDRIPAQRERPVGPSRVREIMSIPALHVAPDCPVAEAANAMIDARVHALLVVENKAVEGVVTSTDLLHHLAGIPDRELDGPVVEHMQSNLRAISRTAPLYQATRLIRDSKVRHLPVVDGEEIVGIVTDRDLRKACGVEAIADEMSRASDSPYVGASRVEDIMSGPVETLTERATFRDAVQLMAARRIGCVPIVRGGQFVGIITDTDCLRYLSQRGA